MESLDRLTIRERPTGRPIIYQTWANLLFMHWRKPVSEIRPHVPSRLTIDTFDGSAWIGVTPFAIRDVRFSVLPAVPGARSSHELNVRTYEHLAGVPGVWFFSLDASNPIAVTGARLLYALPYYKAQMSLVERDGAVHFNSRRTLSGAPGATLEATWSRGEALPEANPGSLEFFLMERYCLYANRWKRLFRARIHHDPWPLHRAALSSYESSMIASHGLDEPAEAPLLHALGDPLRVEVWPLARA